MAGDSDADDMRPLKLDYGEVECVTEFKYLGSIVEAKGGIAQEVGERIAKVSKAFGALREPIFRDSKLSGVKSAEQSSEVSSQPWEATGLPFKCDTCQRAFRRRQDIARHRCVTTRPKGQVASRPPVLSSM